MEMMVGRYVLGLIRSALRGAHSTIDASKLVAYCEYSQSSYFCRGSPEASTPISLRGRADVACEKYPQFSISVRLEQDLRMHLKCVCESAYGIKGEVLPL